MPKIYVRTRAGETRAIEARVNQSVMEALRDNGVGEIEALCGGSCACGTCHVYVDDAFSDKLSRPTSSEDDLLGAVDERRENSRLACQISVKDELDGMRVEVAPA